MRRSPRILLAVMLAALSLAACDKLFHKTDTVTADDMSLGNPTAKVTVIEYASASCPHCAKFNNEVYPAFKAKYIDTGKVFYIFREFLTQPVELAAAAFMLARCAPRGRYFGVIDGMFHAQEEIYASHEIK